MKPVEFLGDSLRRIRKFPDEIRQELGYPLHRVQCGDQPIDFKAMPSIGQGVEEIRLRDASGAYRVIYTASRANAVYVLHALEKKSRETAKRDIEIAIRRYASISTRQP
jgi:phage-related protein